MYTQHSFTAYSVGSFMLDEMTMLALIGMIATHAHLIRKCSALESDIPQSTARLEGSLAGIHEMLDEALDMMNELPAAAVDAVMPQQNMGGSIPEMILSTLLARTGLASEHGNTQKPQEWEIFPPNDPTQTNE